MAVYNNGLRQRSLCNSLCLFFPETIFTCAKVFTATALILAYSAVHAVPFPVESGGPSLEGASSPNSAQLSASRNNVTGTAIASSGRASAALPYYFDSVKTFTFGTFGGTEVWGWIAPNGDDYAIMGIAPGVVIVNATTLQVIDTVPGPVGSCGSTLWREMKTYQNYCYCVSECTGANAGLMVIDLQYLPDSAHLVGVFSTSIFSTVTSHTISIDTLRGYAYLEGEIASHAIHIFDLANPEAPVYVNSFGPPTGTIHDMTAFNDTVWVAEGSAGSFSIWDLSNKAAPQLLRRVNIPSGGYVHNIWPTDSRSHVITTEETGNKTVKIWNTASLTNIRLVSEYLGSSNLAHNAHMLGDFAYLSHYESGIRLLDMRHPNCPREVAAFDTYPVSESPNFNGCWGIFPYTADSLVYASNLNGKLFVLRLRVDSTFIDTAPDSDGDTVPNSCDNCVLTANADQLDGDFDDVGDICDPCPTDPLNDQDSDGYCAEVDNCVDIANNSQTDSDGDGIGDPCDNCPLDSLNDAEADDFCAEVDNCPNVSNTAQEDSDDDGIGDACDTCPADPINDPDGDGLCAGVDNCDYIANLTQTDSDGDNVGDACDACPTQPNPCGCCNLAGDADNGGDVNIGDAVILIAYIFLNGPAAPCQDEADADGDNAVTIGDAVTVISYIFLGGAPPVCGSTGQ